MSHHDQHGNESGSSVPERGRKIDLNRASRDEILGLEGMGEQMADRIIQARDREGGFKSLEDLDRVDGIGQGTLDNLRRQVSVSGGGERGSQSRGG